MTAAERRIQVLDILLAKRKTTTSALANEFHVSRFAVMRDIRVLSIFHPIFTVTGPGGGVYIADGYRLGMKYLTDIQTDLLERLSETLCGDDLATMQGILKTFRRPTA